MSLSSLLEVNPKTLPKGYVLPVVLIITDT